MIWNFIKFLLKGWASLRLMNGIIYGLNDPKKNLLSLAICFGMGWLIWKMWAKKPVPKSIPIAPKKDRYVQYKMVWAK